MGEPRFAKAVVARSVVLLDTFRRFRDEHLDPTHRPAPWWRSLDWSTRLSVSRGLAADGWVHPRLVTTRWRAAPRARALGARQV